jgi:hypothetical protein
MDMYVGMFVSAKPNEECYYLYVYASQLRPYLKIA